MRRSVKLLTSFALLVGGSAWAQERPIVGQDAATAERGEGPTGWVQAPSPRGYNAPQQAAQGAGPATGQPPAEQNPGTPVGNPLPSAAGTTSR